LSFLNSAKKLLNKKKSFLLNNAKLIASYKEVIEQKHALLNKDNEDQATYVKEITAIVDSIDKNVESFIEKLKIFDDPTIKERVLVKELLNKEKIDLSNIFDPVNFHVLGSIIEYAILTNLVELYEDCLREFIVIADRIETLEEENLSN